LRSFPIYVALILLAVPVAGCQSSSIGQAAFGEETGSLADRPDAEVLASDRPVALGIAQFEAGNFGKAQQAFKRATELAPNDGLAWLGLAASYDRLRRFDAADVAYRQAARALGERPEYYNNVGYSYLLRGNLREAHRNFTRAQTLDPANPITANNLALLRSTIEFGQPG
jgi:Flp pilus assembly protein TadD